MAVPEGTKGPIQVVFFFLVSRVQSGFLFYSVFVRGSQRRAEGSKFQFLFFCRKPKTFFEESDSYSIESLWG